MTYFTDRLSDLMRQLYHHEHRTIDLYAEKSVLERELAAMDEKIDEYYDVAQDAYYQVCQFLLSRIDVADPEVDDHLDWQLGRYLAGDPLEDVVAELDKCITSVANATKVARTAAESGERAVIAELSAEGRNHNVRFSHAGGAE